MGLLDRVMGTDDDGPKYQCSACQEIFEPESESVDDLRCPVCGDRNVSQFD